MLSLAMLKVNFLEIVTGTPVEEPTLYIDPSMVEGLVGETFSININIVDIIDLWGYEFKLGYDNTILNATEAFIPEGHFLTPETPGMFFIVDPGTIHQEEGYVYFAGTLLAPEEPKSGSGILGTISFIVIDEGESELALFDTILVNGDIESIPHDVIDGYFATPIQAPDEVVTEEVIVPEELETDLIAFRMPAPLQPIDVITPSVENGHEYVPDPDKTVWFYWINDCPYAGYAHESRYVFIEEETGEYEVFVEEWPPMLNGEEIWTDPEEYWNPENWVYSTTNSTQASTAHVCGLTSMIETTIGSIRNVQSQSAKRALIIEGHDHPKSTSSIPSSFQNASELWYDLFKDFGYTDQEIVYLTPEARQNEYDVDYTCTKQNVATAIQDLTTLNDGDTLIVFIAAHGDVKDWNDLTGYVQLTDGRTLLYDYELTQQLGQITSDVNITIIIQSCYCGSFMDDLWTLNNVDTIITSTDWKSVSYMASAGMDPPFVYGGIPGMEDDPNWQDEGGEFSSGFRKGLDDSWQLYIDGYITLGELYVKAYKKGIELDAGYINRETLADKYGDSYKPNPLMITIFFPGDLNLDFKVNVLDVASAAKAYDSKPGNAAWYPIADMDRNRWINIVDVSKVASHFNRDYETT